MIKRFFFDLFRIKRYELNAWEKEIYDYFLETALKSEYGYHPKRVIKWTNPMKMFISQKEKYKTQVSIIKETIEKINNLVSDGFRIELTESANKSNTIIYLANKERINELRKTFLKEFDVDFVGLADVEFDLSSFNILKARIFIDTDEKLEEQKATILEEITQSIGLLNDSEIYPDSTFFQNKLHDIQKFHNHSDIDKEIIKLLYSTRMKPGLDSKDVKKVFRRYYGEKKT